MPSRAYAVTTPIGEGATHTYYVDAPTSRKGASKARMEALRNAWDAGFRLSFGDVRVRSLGIRDTPRELAEREAAEFNRRCPIGTAIRVWPGTRPGRSYDTEVREPGAFVSGSGNSLYVCVQVPGDWIAITHAEAIDAPQKISDGCVPDAEIDEDGIAW